MSPSKEDEFKGKTVPQIQDEFFRHGFDDGTYQYQKSGINTVKHSVVLFQFANRILALARFKESIPNDKPVDGKYHGTLYFDPKSVRVFPEALRLEQIQEFWPAVKKLSNAKRKLAGKPYLAFEKRYLKAPYGRMAADSNLGPAKRIPTVTMRYIRDTQKTLRVKSMHSYRCQVLDCPFPSTLPDGSDYAEGHHLKPLGHNGPDDERNILCLCAYHHVAFDMGAIRIDDRSLRTVEGHLVSPEFIAYHNKRIFAKGQ